MKALDFFKEQFIEHFLAVFDAFFFDPLPLFLSLFKGVEAQKEVLFIRIWQGVHQLIGVFQQGVICCLGSFIVGCCSFVWAVVKAFKDAQDKPLPIGITTLLWIIRGKHNVGVNAFELGGGDCYFPQMIVAHNRNFLA